MGSMSAVDDPPFKQQWFQDEVSRKWYEEQWTRRRGQKKVRHNRKAMTDDIADRGSREHVPPALPRDDDA